MINYPISIFIDSNIFDSTKYDFDSNWALTILSNLANEGKVNICLSNIVVGEIKRHIKRDIASLYSEFRTARKRFKNNTSKAIAENNLIKNYFSEADEEKVVDEFISNFESYLSKISATIIDSSGVDCDVIIADYFNGTLPFEEKEAKRHEFPDAIMAHKLKLLFDNKSPLTIISNDNGFRKIFDKVNGFTTYPNLKDLYNEISKQEHIYTSILAYLKEANVEKKLVDMIARKIQDTNWDIDSLDCDRKGVCEGYEYDETYTDVVDDVTVALGSVDEITDTTVIVTLSCKANIGAYCYYTDYANSPWDSEDNEYIYLETGAIYEQHSPKFDCEVKFDISNKDSKISFEIDIVKFDLELNQWSRISQEYVDNNPEEDAKADMMDTLEEYHRH